MSEHDDGGAGLQEEPQSERGEPGSRDEGFPPGEGPANRPVGTSDADDHTAVHPQESQTGTTLPTGDGGG